MIIVDTHCHATPIWFEPVEVLLDQMNRNGVEKAVLIQINGQYDNTYQFECMNRFPGRFSSVVMVDVESPDAPDQLEHLVAQGAQGVRLRPTDPLSVWRKAAQLGIPVSSPGTQEQFASEDFQGMVEQLPSLPIVIEHLGFVRPDDQPPYNSYRRVLALARYRNTYIKVPGLGEICHRPRPFPSPFTFGTVPPFIQMAYDAFGASRMMWGSDFPPVANREGYHNCLQLLMDHIQYRSQADKEWIFGKTALSLWRFDKK